MSKPRILLKKAKIRAMEDLSIKSARKNCLISWMMNSLTDLSKGYIQAYKKSPLKEDPNTFEKAGHFAKRCSCLDAFTLQLQQYQLVC